MRFDDVTALDEHRPGRFGATVDPRWTIGGKPNGGYLLAILGRAAVRVSAQPHVIAASAHYLRPPRPGGVTVGVDVLRAGRSTDQFRAWLSQDGHPCVEALLTCARLPDPHSHEQPDGSGAAPPAAADDPTNWDGGVPRAPATPFTACERLPGTTPAGVAVPIMDEVEVRLDPETMGFARGRPSGRGELRGWLALPDDQGFEAVSLLYAVDAFPPATFDVRLSRWVPTLELTAYVRALPAPGPVRVLHRAQSVQGGLVDEVTLVWDSTGRLVASGTQLAGIRFAAP